MTIAAEAPARPTYRTLCGNITRDPELRFSAKGTAWSTAGLAVNPRKRLDDGTYEEQPSEFYELVCFGDLAEHLAESLGKGDRVVATGRLEHETWTGRDGEERTTDKLLADDVGPSLRFATAAVARTKREGPPERPSSDGGYGYGYDEEPF